MEAKVHLDHVELSSEQVIVGLGVKWMNETAEPLDIREVTVNLFQRNQREPLAHLTYNGRFVRIPFQKAITRIAGANSFHVAAAGVAVENLRFLTREINNLRDGVYIAELYTTVPAGTYLHTFELKVTPEFKHRSGSEVDTGVPVAVCSSAFTRALRIGTNANR